MTPERWKRIQELVQSAIERPAAERAAFLASACGDDAALKDEVGRLLLASGQTEGGMSSPAAALLAGAGGDRTPATGTLGPRDATPGSPSGRAVGAATTTFAAGEVVGERYRILRFIAQGGMGEVYEAEDLALHGRLALKTIRPEIAADGLALARFKREIHIARQVTHPNVCRIYDLGTHRAQGQEVLFLTMEMLSGESLSDRIARARRLTPAEALPIVSQMAAGLDAAHALGIIHRDFKSANVMLVPDPRGGTRAVVTDFGLARGITGGDGMASISDTGAVAGTPAYMAPEQVQGLELTPAADTYALGIVMYEMVAGVRPFEGGSAMTVAVRRLTEAPAPPRRHVPDLDAAWEAAILRCLERDPAARFARTADLVKALGEPARALASEDSVTRTAGRMVSGAPTVLTGRRHQWTAAAVLGVLVAVGAGYAVVRQRTRSVGPSAAAPAPAAVVAPRRAVAVLGLKNVAGRADAGWLSTAVSEMLTMDLAAGGKVRTVPGGEVVRARKDLGLAEVDSLTAEQLSGLRGNLAVDLVVFGSYTVVSGGENRLLRIDLRLQDAATGQAVASGTASGTEGQLFDLVSRAAGPLREKLGLGAVTPAQGLEVEASLPSNRVAARLYAEGLASLQVFNATAAREALEKAVAAEPKHPLPHAALAEAWSLLGYDGKAAEEAKRAASLSEALPPAQKLAIEARFYEIAKDWPKAIESYQSLVKSQPDDLEHGLKLAQVQISAGKAKQALVTLEGLGSLPKPLSEDPRINVAQARAFLDLGDRQKQQSFAAQAAAKAKARGARLLLARARLLEASALDALGDPKQATAASEEARGLYEAVGDRGGVARALLDLAVMLYGRSDLDGARRLLERSLGISREIGDRRTTALVLQDLGNVASDLGQASTARKLHDESLSTFRQIGAKIEAAGALNNMGARLQNAGNLAGAQQRYQEALALYGEVGERTGVARTLTNVAEVLFARGDLKKARDMHEESLAICREIGDKDVAAYDLYRLGILFAASGDARAAKDKYEEALVLQRELGDKISAAQTRLGLALLALAQDRAAEAESLARGAEEDLRVGGATDPTALAQAILAEALLVQGKTAEAASFSEKASAAAAKSDDPGVRTATTIAAARVRAASGKAPDVAAALSALDAARAQVAKVGLVKEEYEARMALGELEVASGQAAAGRARLQALAKEADAKGFGSIARRAAKQSS
jgi:Tfp pilus assembly protein PilF/tRNA A-37 threonylcarbamoyl transferase component Bud32